MLSTSSTTRHAVPREKEGAIPNIHYMIESPHIRFCVVICNFEKKNSALMRHEISKAYSSTIRSLYETNIEYEITRKKVEEICESIEYIDQVGP